MKRCAIWSVILLVLGLASCGRAKDQQYISLDIRGITAEDSPWYLYTYGTHTITIDTLEVNSNGRIDWEKDLDIDTLDMLLLFNSKGLLEMPFLPSREGSISAKIDKEGLLLEGVQEVDSIQSWYRAKEQGVGALHHFLTQYQSNGIVLVMTSDAINRDKMGECTKELLEIQSMLSNKYSEMVELLGFNLLVRRQSELMQVPYGFRIPGEENIKAFRDMISKRDLMVINVIQLTPEDSIAFKGQKDYFAQLDSLKLLSYSVLLNDELPKGITKGANRYFLVDSTGYAVEYIREYNIQSIPTYMLVDSARQVWRTWGVADSLVQFIKEYRDVGRRVD